ncbi:HD domain-containing phosphohydrolase [Novispirillum sp. DQ9]|uniref:HD domain-containing phosphohydrolase n=1 Tax=Novispirillum sp. DQ9 TaxID=3398612 RepID=UPI003C7DBF63
MQRTLVAELALNGALSLSFLGLWVVGLALAEKTNSKTVEWAAKAGLLAFAGGLTIAVGTYVDAGVLFDQRGAIIGLSVLHAGPLGGALTALSAGMARWWVGGAGALAGLSGILLNVVLAVAVLRVLDRAVIKDQRIRLLAVGMAVGVGEASSVWLVPGLADAGRLAAVLFAAQFSGTLLIGGMLGVLEERRRLRGALKERVNRLNSVLHQMIDAFTTATVHTDPYTAGHERRVADLCKVIGQRMGLSQDRLDGLVVAAQTHDIGQMSIPPEILLRPGRLTPLETRFVAQHPEVGAQILSSVDFPWPVAAIVRQHHENCDGTGYPDGLVQQDILLEARILRVADTMEALCSHRPFRDAFSYDEALGMLEDLKGSAFDPDVVDCCRTLVSQDGYRFPSGGAQASGHATAISPQASVNSHGHV